MSAPPSIGNLLLLTLTPLLLSCDGERAERGPPTARFDSTQLAEAIFEYDSAAFRNIEWTSQERAVDRGETVWQYSCQWCHGLDGEGKSGLVLRGQTFSTPSFLGPEWHLAGSP